MESQHTVIDEGLAVVGAELAAWRTNGGEAEGQALADALDEHRGQLVRHLDDEEAMALPLVAEHLTVAEWNTVGDRGLERIPRSKRLLALGAILEEATPQEQAYFLGKLPHVGRIMWRLSGCRQYRAACRAVRGPLNVES